MYSKNGTNPFPSLLGNMLTDEKTKGLLGEEFANYLDLKFTDQKGINLRNDVSHGLLDDKHFTRSG